MEERQSEDSPRNRIVTQAGYECPMIITPKDYLEKINV